MKRDTSGRFTSNGLRGEENLNWKGGLVEVYCASCSKPLQRYPHRILKNKWHFCNSDCKKNWQSISTDFRGINHPCWKGGKIVDKAGYIQVRKPSHHRAKSNGYVCEHIIIAEEKYHREIQVGEHIHHLNGIKNDNRPENLLLTTNKEHDKFSYIHGLQERIRELENQST